MSRVTEEATILHQDMETPRRIYRLRLHSPRVAEAAAPGRFVHVRMSSGFDPLLRRPLSLHLVEGQELVLVYRVVGRGTEIMAGLKPGEKLDLLGPLGRGFEPLPGKRHILLGGGLGVPPINYLTHELAGSGETGTVILGFADIDDLYAVEELERLDGFEVMTTTEDGSFGYKGLLTDVLPGGPELENAAVYACGPIPMLAAAARWAEENGLPCQVSLEERMGCGLGACLGCAVPVRANSSEPNPILYRRVCTDGPVFAGSFIDWEELVHAAWWGKRTESGRRT